MIELEADSLMASETVEDDKELRELVKCLLSEEDLRNLSSNTLATSYTTPSFIFCRTLNILSPLPGRGLLQIGT